GLGFAHLGTDLRTGDRAMDSNSPAAWLPHSFHRSPAWRWARASWLAERRGRISRRLDDDWVGRAKRFLTARNQLESGASPERVRPFDPVIQAALDLSCAAPPSRRWRVEALLLTRESFGEVAGRSQVPIDVVEAYHELFFAVRGHLAATDWILTAAVGTS